jgi:hypothetical protein
MNAAYSLLNNWEGAPWFRSGGGSDGVAFVNVDSDETQNNDEATALVSAQGGKANRKDKSKITCFSCCKKGHYMNECTGKTKGSDDAAASEQQGAGVQPEGKSGAQMLMAAAADG